MELSTEHYLDIFVNLHKYLACYIYDIVMLSDYIFRRAMTCLGVLKIHIVDMLLYKLLQYYTYHNISDL